MGDDLTAEQVRDLLGLEPNQTCGFVRLTYTSRQRLAAGTLPESFAAERPVGTALYFMVTPQAPVRLHRIRNDQLYHYYRGDPLELVLMKVDGSTEWPGVVPADVELGDAEALAKKYPAVAAEIRSYPTATPSASRRSSARP